MLSHYEASGKLNCALRENKSEKAVASQYYYENGFGLFTSLI